MAGKQSTVELVIRARDESQRALNSAKAGLTAFVTAQQRAATYRGLVQNQRETAAAATQAAKALKTVGLAASVEQVRGFKAAREAARRAKDEVQAYKIALASAPAPAMGAIPGIAALPNTATAVGPATQMAAATDRERKATLAAAAAARQHGLAMGVQARAAREVTAAEQALAAVQMSVDASAEQVISAQRRVTASYAAAETASRRVTAAQLSVANAQKQVLRGSNDAASGLARAWSTRSGRGFLGLRPYELQNLSYQVNDVFTQIASGTPVMQVAAQQGGQFAQLFPRVIAGALRLAPVIGLVTLALSPFITSLLKANAEAKTLAEFERLLTRSGNAADYSAPKLAAIAAVLDDYSGSIQDARSALTEFVGDAVDPVYLERFGKAALDLSKVMGVDVSEAAKTVSDAFTGNADAVLALDDQLGFLTMEERKHAEALREQKRDAELRTQAFAIFERRYGETAAKMRGPWSQILRDFGAAWDAFADAVNLIDFREASAKIDRLAARIQRLTGMLPGANKSGLDNMRATLLRNFSEIERIEDAQATARENGTLGRGGDALRVRQQAERAAFLRRENDDLRRRIALEVARQPGNGLLGPTADPADTTTRPPAPAYTPPRSGTSDADRLAKQRADFLASLQQESVARQFQLSLIDLTERQTRVLAALEQARVRAAELGLELSAEQVKTIEDEVRAQYDAEQAARGRQLIEQATLELAQARGDIESEEAFVTRKLREANLAAIGEIDAATGDMVVTLTSEAAAYGDILRNIFKINEATRQRAEAEKQVADMTALRTDLQNRATFLWDTGRGAEADAILPQIEAVNAQIVAAANNAITMWAAIGGPEAEAAIAVLKTTRDEAQGLASDMIVSGRQISEMLADGGADAIGQFAQSIGEGVNAVHALGDAFRNFAADFLRQIAQMIAKQAVLNLLQSIGGSGGGGQGGNVGSAGASLVNALFKHTGGTAGETGIRRPVPLAAFANARRFHTGGMPGLKRNEVPTVVENTEGVFTKGQMAALAPVGKGAGSVKIVNVFDPAEALERGLSTEAGERVLMNFVQRNSGAFKAILG